MSSLSSNKPVPLQLQSANLTFPQDTPVKRSGAGGGGVTLQLPSSTHKHHGDNSPSSPGAQSPSAQSPVNTDRRATLFGGTELGKAKKVPGLKLVAQNMIAGHAMHAEEKRLAALRMKIHSMLQEMHRESKKRMIIGEKDDDTLPDRFRDAIFEIITADIHTQSENKKRVHHVEAHMDFLTKQLERRGQFANEQRQVLLQEIVSLNEQVRVLREANNNLLGETKKKILRQALQRSQRAASPHEFSHGTMPPGGPSEFLEGGLLASSDENLDHTGNREELEALASKLNDIMVHVPEVAPPVDVHALVAQQDDEWKAFVSTEAQEKHKLELQEEARQRLKGIQMQMRKEVTSMTQKTQSAAKEAMKKTLNKVEHERDEAKRSITEKEIELRKQIDNDKKIMEKNFDEMVQKQNNVSRLANKRTMMIVNTAMMQAEEVRSSAAESYHAMQARIRDEVYQRQELQTKYNALEKREKELKKADAMLRTEIQALKETLKEHTAAAAAAGENGSFSRRKSNVSNSGVLLRSPEQQQQQQPQQRSNSTVGRSMMGSISDTENVMKIETLTAEVADLKRQLAETKQQLVEANKIEHQRANEQKAVETHLRKEVEDKETSIATYKSIVTQLEEKVTTLQKAQENEAKSWRRALDHRKSHMTDLEATIESLRKANAEFDRINKELLLKSKEAQVVTGYVGDDLEMMVRSRTTELNFVLARQKYQITDLETDVETKSKDITFLQARLQQVVDENNQLNEELEKLEVHKSFEDKASQSDDVVVSSVKPAPPKKLTTRLIFTLFEQMPSYSVSVPSTPTPSLKSAGVSPLQHSMISAPRSDTPNTVNSGNTPKRTGTPIAVPQCHREVQTMDFTPTVPVVAISISPTKQFSVPSMRMAADAMTSMTPTPPLVGQQQQQGKPPRPPGVGNDVTSSVALPPAPPPPPPEFLRTQQQGGAATKGNRGGPTASPVFWNDMSEIVSRAQRDQGDATLYSTSGNTNPRFRSPHKAVTVTAGSSMHPSWSFVRGTRSSWTQTGEVCMLDFFTDDAMMESVLMTGENEGDEWIGVLPCMPVVQQGSTYMFTALTSSIPIVLSTPSPPSEGTETNPQVPQPETVLSDATVIQAIASKAPALKKQYDMITTRYRDESVSSYKQRLHATRLRARQEAIQAASPMPATQRVLVDNALRSPRVVNALDPAAVSKPKKQQRPPKKAADPVFEAPAPYYPTMVTREPPALKAMNNPYSTMKGQGTARSQYETVEESHSGWSGREGRDVDPFLLNCTTHLYPSPDTGSLPQTPSMIPAPPVIPPHRSDPSSSTTPRPFVVSHKPKTTTTTTSSTQQNKPNKKGSGIVVSSAPGGGNQHMERVEFTLVGMSQFT